MVLTSSSVGLISLAMMVTGELRGLLKAKSFPHRDTVLYCDPILYKLAGCRHSYQVLDYRACVALHFTGTCRFLQVRSKQPVSDGVGRRHGGECSSANNPIAHRTRAPSRFSRVGRCLDGESFFF